SERNDPGISGEQADPDGDGHSNLDEFRAGTDPRDAASVLKLDVEMTGDRQIRFRVHAVRERTYAIEWREDVTNGEWQVLQVIPAPAVDGVVEVSDPAGTLSAGPRFYRVVTPAPELGGGAGAAATYAGPRRSPLCPRSQSQSVVGTAGVPVGRAPWTGGRTVPGAFQRCSSTCPSPNERLPERLW